MIHSQQILQTALSIKLHFSIFQAIEEYVSYTEGKILIPVSLPTERSLIMVDERTLKGHELFAKLSVDEVNQLDSFSHVQEYDECEKIFEYNEVCSHIYMLMEGVVYLMLPAEPTDYSFAIAEIKNNEIFGLSPLLNSPRYTAEAKCHTRCKVLSIEAESFKNLLMNNNHVGLEVSNQVARIYYKRYLNTLRKLQDLVSQVSIVQ
jgi:signal-transduction protein with cAMP-binding, CBS, and nucleotidyltransferase domain